MSAGKGDRPRPVDGDRYRANYEAIWAPPYPCTEPRDFGHLKNWPIKPLDFLPTVDDSCRQTPRPSAAPSHGH